jgi:hypothetical protein
MLHQTGEGRVEIVLCCRIGDNERAPECIRRRLRKLHVGFRIRIVWINQHADHGRFWNRFTQKLETLGHELVDQKSHARHVSARPIEAVDESKLDWIRPKRENNRNCSRCSLGCHCRRGCIRHDQVDLSADQFGRQDRQPIIAALGKSKVECHVLTLDKKPDSFNPCRIAESCVVSDCGVCMLSTPTTGVAPCCARAASGQAATAPPTSDMNLRRFIVTRSPRRRWRASPAEL